MLLLYKGRGGQVTMDRAHSLDVSPCRGSNPGQGRPLVGSDVISQQVWRSAVTPSVAPGGQVMTNNHSG